MEPLLEVDDLCMVVKVTLLRMWQWDVALEEGSGKDS